MLGTKKSLIIVLLVLLSISVFTACSTDYFQQKPTAVELSEKAKETATEISSLEKKSTFLSSTSEIIKEKTTKKKPKKSISIKTTSAITTDFSASSSVTETESESDNVKRSFISKLGNKTKKKGEDKEKNFFDNAVFIGDSVSLGLKNYVTDQRHKGNECLGNAQFLVAGCMGFTNSLGEVGKQNTIHPKYNGKEVMVDDGVNMIGAKKAFIMLGLNDFCAYPLATSMKNAKIFIGRIIEKNPDIKIYIQSVTPVISAKERGKFNNDSINKFNEALIQLCEENNWTYVDIASSMKNENGCFKDEYCCDKNAQGVHMTYSAYRVWIDCLNEKF